MTRNLCEASDPRLILLQINFVQDGFDLKHDLIFLIDIFGDLNLRNHVI